MGNIREELVSYLDFLESEGSQAQTFGNLYKLAGLAGLATGAIASVTLPGWGLAILAISGAGYFGTLSKEGKLISRILPLPFLSLGLDTIIKGLASVSSDGMEEELIPYHFLDSKEKSDYAMLSVLLDDIAAHLECLPDEVTQRVEWNRISRRFHQAYSQFIGNNPDVLAMKADRQQLREFILATPEKMRELTQGTQQPLLTQTVTVDAPAHTVLTDIQPAVNYLPPSVPSPSNHKMLVIESEPVAAMDKEDLWSQESLSIPATASQSDKSFFFDTASRIAMPKTEIISHPSSAPVRDVVGELAANLKSTLMIGVPGAGKGMLMSHLVRRIRLNYPELKIIGIDPKDDPKETGYWSECFDKVYRANNERLDDRSFVDWMKGAVDYFRMLPDGKILIWDEFTISCRRWSTQDKASFNEIISWMISVCSSGDSRRNYVFAVGQIPNATDMGMTGGSRGIFKPIGILSNHDRGKVQQFITTSFTPTPKGGIEELYQIMNKSPAGRAIYCWNTGMWEPMPILENFSGYDRDSRTFLDSFNSPVEVEAELEQNDENPLKEDIQSWIDSSFRPGDIITPSKAATSSWVAKGKRQGILADARSETVSGWMDKMKSLQPLDQGWLVK